MSVFCHDRKANLIVEMELNVWVALCFQVVGIQGLFPKSSLGAQGWSGAQWDGGWFHLLQVQGCLPCG